MSNNVCSQCFTLFLCKKGVVIPKEEWICGVTEHYHIGTHPPRDAPVNSERGMTEMRDYHGNCGDVTMNQP